MFGGFNSKILGASVAGVALIIGAYTLGHSNQYGSASQSATIQNSTAPQRVSIAVSDSDGDGVQDWQDEFVTTDAITFTESTSDYVPPDTLTGKVGIKLLGDSMEARSLAPFGKSDEEVVAGVVDFLVEQTKDEFYETDDLTIIDNWNDDDIVNYANALANIMARYQTESTDGELAITYDIVVNKNDSRLSDLQERAEVYKNYRDDTLALPVPAFLTKEHLDLINVYEAIRADIVGMTMYSEDPAVGLLRLKRHDDNLTALSYVLQNMFLMLEPHSSLFTIDDPAVLLVTFSPDYQN